MCFIISTSPQTGRWCYARHAHFALVEYVSDSTQFEPSQRKMPGRATHSWICTLSLQAAQDCGALGSCVLGGKRPKHFNPTYGGTSTSVKGHGVILERNFEDSVPGE